MPAAADHVAQRGTYDGYAEARGNADADGTARRLG
jgi:hypothetical protein